MKYSIEQSEITERTDQINQFALLVDKYNRNDIDIEKFISEFRNQSNELIDNTLKYDIQHLVDNNNFDLQDNYRLDYFLSKRI